MYTVSFRSGNRQRLALRSMIATFCAVLGIATGPGFGAAATGQTIKEIPAPGKVFDIGGYRLHINCIGAGSPTVVIDAGAGSWSSSWTQVQELVAEDTRVCTYDRAGLGWSDVSPRNRTVAVMTEELHALLKAAQEPPPYVMAGHSFGGYTVRVFARSHPEEVAGVVLIDAAHEDQWERLPPEVKAFADASLGPMGQAQQAAGAGMLPAEMLPDSDYFGRAPELQAVYEAELTAPEHYGELIATMSALEMTSTQVRRAGSLGATPLMVLSAGNSFGAFADVPLPHARSNEVWGELQRDLATLSSNVEHMVSEDATHEIHWTHPNLVSRAILKLVGKTRAAQLPGVLPQSAGSEVDGLLERLERVYARKNTEAFVDLFSDDFIQHDVNRRVLVEGREAWTQQTDAINMAHHELTRTHGGRIQIGDWLIVETTWTGTIRGEALGIEGVDRSYNYSGLTMMQVVRGKIRRQLIYADHATLLSQVGPLP